MPTAGQVLLAPELELLVGPADRVEEGSDGHGMRERRGLAGGNGANLGDCARAVSGVRGHLLLERVKAREHGREVHVAANAAAADAPGRSAAAAEADSAAAAAEVGLREEASVAVGRLAGRGDERAAAAEGSTETAKAAATEDALLLRGRLLREEHKLGELLGAEQRQAAAGVRCWLVAGGAGFAGAISRAHARCGRAQAPRNLSGKR